jgi:hypothetical protein
MYLLDERSSSVTQCIFPLMAGIGIGMLFHAPYQVFIKSLKPHEIATGTGAFFLVRFTGATVGLVSRNRCHLVNVWLKVPQAVSGSVFWDNLGDRTPPDQWSGPSINFGLLKSILPLSLQSEVLHAVSTSIQVCLSATDLESLSIRDHRSSGPSVHPASD